MFIRAYLRASTKEQDASRAREELEIFASSKSVKIASFYIENESGASLKRPELFRLLNDCQNGDVLLVEQVDRLSRLNSADWQKLKGLIAEKQIRIVALDLPTSHQLTVVTDEFTSRMFEAINSMLLDMLAAIARKDYDDRRRRQSQGIAKAKADGRYQGRKPNLKKHKRIAKLLSDEVSWSEIQEDVGCSRGTIATVKKRMTDG